MIEDRCGDGSRAGDALRVRDGVPASTQALKVRLECRTAGVRWTGAHVKEGEDRLAARAEVERRLRTEFDGLADGVPALELLGVYPDAASQHAERSGLAGTLADRM